MAILSFFIIFYHFTISYKMAKMKMIYIFFILIQWGIHEQKQIEFSWE